MLAHVAEHHGFDVEGHWKHDADGWSYLEWGDHRVLDSEYNADVAGAVGALSLRATMLPGQGPVVRWLIDGPDGLVAVPDVASVEKI
mgnify:CR=1 FL=1